MPRSGTRIFSPFNSILLRPNLLEAIRDEKRASARQRNITAIKYLNLLNISLKSQIKPRSRLTATDADRCEGAHSDGTRDGARLLMATAWIPSSGEARVQAMASLKCVQIESRTDTAEQLTARRGAGSRGRPDA